MVYIPTHVVSVFEQEHHGYTDWKYLCYFHHDNYCHGDMTFDNLIVCGSSVVNGWDRIN